MKQEVEALKNYINGEWIKSKTKEYREVRNPATDEPLSSCPMSTTEEVDMAVKSAKQAFWNWRMTPPTERVECLFNLKSVLEKSKEELARIIVNENGKTYDEALGEMFRAVQYTEHACAITELLKGDFSEDIARGIDEYCIREPLGVFIFIPPFNFPALMPIYFVWAVASGDTVIIKPSSECPITTQRIAELTEECGFPKGVINVVYGSGSKVGAQLISHPDVEGVTFVGSSQAAQTVYETATSHGKRAQCQGGAKNFIVVMEDAQIDEAVRSMRDSLFGSASQRCMAGSNVLAVEKIYEEVKERLINAAKKMRLGYGLDEGVDLGPVVNRKSLNNLLNEIEFATKDNAKLLLDGRNSRVEKHPNGCFLGPTIFEAEPGMKVFDEEIFGPIRCIKKVKNLREAISVANDNKYGHSTIIYTENGKYARELTRGVNVGQVGVNIGIPAPIAFYPIGGRKKSFFGSTRGRANDAIDFYTDKKVVISRWFTPI